MLNIIDQLKVALANHIDASLIVQSYHWCIEGLNFNEYHDFFATVYETYYSQVDRLAEYVRIVSKGSEYVVATVDVVKANKTIKTEAIVGNKPVEMVNAIILINSALLDGFVKLFETASTKEQGLADYCAAQIDVLNKLAWKLTVIRK